MRERSIENHLKTMADQAGGLCIKLSPIGYVGIPDRLLILPGGYIVFVECKKPKYGVIARAQVWWRKELLKLGCRHVFVLTKDDVAAVFDAWRKEIV